MPKPYFKKEIVYYINKNTEDKAVQELRRDLWDTYDDVYVYSNGLHGSRIVCTIKQ